MPDAMPSEHEIDESLKESFPPATPELDARYSDWVAKAEGSARPDQGRRGM
jgi:hypothetical protein